MSVPYAETERERDREQLAAQRADITAAHIITFRIGPWGSERRGVAASASRGNAHCCECRFSARAGFGGTLAFFSMTSPWCLVNKHRAVVGPTSLSASRMRDEVKARSLPRPATFTGYTGRRRVNETRARARRVYPGVCRSSPAAVEQC